MLQFHALLPLLMLQLFAVAGFLKTEILLQTNSNVFPPGQEREQSLSNYHSVPVKRTIANICNH